MSILFKTCCVFFLLLLQACSSLFYSSLPNFKPTKPVEEAASFAEAIAICSEYQIEEKLNKDGSIKLQNSFSVVPWMRCFEFPIRNFSDADHHEDLFALYREFGRLHAQDSKHENQFIHSSRMNQAVNSIFKFILENDSSLLIENKVLISQQLSEYAFYLNESGRFIAESSNAKASKVNRLIYPKKLKKFTLQEESYCKIIKLEKYRASVFEKNSGSIEVKKLDQQILKMKDEYKKFKNKLSPAFSAMMCFDSGQLPDPVGNESSTK